MWALIDFLIGIGRYNGTPSLRQPKPKPTFYRT
jgi:hypothetical protein